MENYVAANVVDSDDEQWQCHESPGIVSPLHFEQTPPPVATPLKVMPIKTTPPKTAPVGPDQFNEVERGDSDYIGDEEPLQVRGVTFKVILSFHVCFCYTGHRSCLDSFGRSAQLKGRMQSNPSA